MDQPARRSSYQCSRGKTQLETETFHITGDCAALMEMRCSEGDLQVKIGELVGNGRAGFAEFREREYVQRV